MSQNNELYHHGVKGQRWGFRRYQNKDGTLTPAGRKRANKLKSQYTELTGKRLVRKSSSQNSKLTNQNGEEPNKKKTIKEMTDAELKEKTNRMNLEREYINAVTSMNDINPKQVSRGRVIANKVASEVVAPAAINVGKQLVTSLLTKLVNEKFNFDEELKVHTNNKKKN